MSGITVLISVASNNAATWNTRIRNATDPELDPGIADSLDVPFAPNWLILDWHEDDDAEGLAVIDALQSEAQARGPFNTPGPPGNPQGQAAWYRTDEDEEDENSPDAELGTATTAPFRGWTGPKIYLVRHKIKRRLLVLFYRRIIPVQEPISKQRLLPSYLLTLQPCQSGLFFYVRCQRRCECLHRLLF